MSRTLAQRKKAVIELIGKNLQKEFESSLTELLRNCLKHRNEAVREETMTGMLCQEERGERVLVCWFVGTRVICLFVCWKQETGNRKEMGNGKQEMGNRK